MLDIKDIQQDLNDQLINLKVKSYTMKAIIDGDSELSDITVSADKDEYDIFGFFNGKVESVKLEEAFGINYLHINLKGNKWENYYSTFNDVISVEWDEINLKLFIVGSHNVDGCEIIGVHILEFERVSAEKVE